MLLFVTACRTAPVEVGPPLPYDLGRDSERQLPSVTLVDPDPDVPGLPLALDELRVDCLSGPDPAFDNEDPEAQADARWRLELSTRGWASVTLGVRPFLWDGVPNPQTGRHALAWRAPESMQQDPSGQSDEPYVADRWELEIPVFENPELASAVGGTTLRCQDPEGSLEVAQHDVMVCATDARDLETRHCWFCGDHLGEPVTALDTVGSVSGAPGPGGSTFSVTASVDCAYGPRE